MSKPVKNLIIKEYQQRFGELDGAVLIDMRGMKAVETNTFRRNLAEKGMKVTIVKNLLARQALGGSKLEPVGPLLDGPTALVYGGESVVDVARTLIDQAKAFKTIQFKGAVLDGQVFAAGEVDALSKYPTRDEAIGQVLGAALGPASQLAAAITGAGATLGAVLKSIEEKLEKGEAIQKQA